MKKVWVEFGSDGQAIRIFKSRRSAFEGEALTRLLDGKASIGEVEKKIATGQIRHQVWERAKGNCEFCGGTMLESTMHLHEKQHRGQFVNGKSGEVSLMNSVGICFKCHQAAHSDREPKFSNAPK